MVTRRDKNSTRLSQQHLDPSVHALRSIYVSVMCWVVYYCFEVATTVIVLLLCVNKLLSTKYVVHAGKRST